MLKNLLLSSILLIFSVNVSVSQSLKLKKNDLKKLASIMAGSYSSEKQSIEDSSFFDIRLRMTPILKNSKDGYWLYVEQAVSSSQDKPYRQRVYHLYQQDDTTIISKVYELKNPSQYIGGWKDKSLLSSIVPDSLIDRQGCGIYLHKISKNIYSGSTPGKECLSSLRGAQYATSEVTIYTQKLVSWDRGWDKDNKQMWGAEKGGYTFLKMKKRSGKRISG